MILTFRENLNQKLKIGISNSMTKVLMLGCLKFSYKYRSCTIYLQVLFCGKFYLFSSIPNAADKVEKLKSCNQMNATFNQIFNVSWRSLMTNQMILSRKWCFYQNNFLVQRVERDRWTKDTYNRSVTRRVEVILEMVK